MNAHADNIWRVPAYLGYLQPPLTDDVIAAAEKIIGYKLPEALLALLRKQNGGYIRYSLLDTLHSLIAGIGPHFPSLIDFSWEEAQEYVSFPLQGLVPFDGDGHWELCLDYRADPDQPSVTYVDIECDSEQQIAASFSEYLSLLTLDVADYFVADSVEIATLLIQLGDALGVKFGPPDLWAYGYPVYSAALGTQQEPECICISHNRVPRGFVREEDSRHDELKDLLRGEGLDFPELTDSCLIVYISDGVHQRVIDAFNTCNIKLQAMRHAIDGGQWRI
jgi:hypothetical protein